MRKKCKRCKMPEVRFTVVLEKEDGEPVQIEPVYIPWDLAAFYYEEAKRRKISVHQLIQIKMWYSFKIFYFTKIPDLVIEGFIFCLGYMLLQVILGLFA